MISTCTYLIVCKSKVRIVVSRLDRNLYTIKRCYFRFRALLMVITLAPNDNDNALNEKIHIQNQIITPTK